ncbi:MAG: electron transport complex subunit RsxC [Actinobacteria bacterium]|nr:electron transport complex subunit RsxC [Actinomycetota bacterium]
MELKTFRGGIHPPYEKEITAGKATVDIPLPDEVVIPMRQHVGAPNKPTVSAGDRVEAGQLIGSSEAFISAPVHSSVSGTVKAVEERRDFSGSMVESVVISVDKSRSEMTGSKKDTGSLDADQIRDIAKNAGLVGLGGAAFPTYVKLSPPAGKPIDTVIINGCECEPFLTCDHRAMLEKTADLIAGLKLMMKAVGAESGIIGIESNKMDAAEALSAKLASEAVIDVVMLEVKYPEGAEKMLIEAVSGRKVPPGKLPSEVGVLVQNVQTAIALNEAAETGKPCIERVITVTGPGIKEPKNLNVKIGTPVSFVIDQCGGISGNVSRVVMGGPMTGWAQKDLDVPVQKGTSGLVLLTSDVAASAEERQCVGCDKCVDVCPMFLMPNLIVKYAKRGQYELSDRAGAKDCFECGCCTYACPSRIPHVSYVRKAKAELAAADKK